MRRLILMRHAKSDWSFSEPDHDRALNKRGRKSAEALGDWLRERRYLPDEALVSTALRTRQSWDLLAIDAPVRHERALYHAEPQTMLEVLRGAERRTVLMLGHNPGICELAHALVAKPPAHARFDDYPTGATLVIEFPIEDWERTEPGTGRVLDFVVPRELV